MLTVGEQMMLASILRSESLLVSADNIAPVSPPLAREIVLSLLNTVVGDIGIGHAQDSESSSGGPADPGTSSGPDNV